MADVTHRKRRVLAWTALSLAVLLTVVIAAVHTAYVQGQIWTMVQNALATSGLRLTAGSFGFNLFSGNLELGGVEVAAMDSNLPPIARAESVKVTYATRELLTGRIRLDHLKVAGLRLLYTVDAQGRDNLPVLKGDGGKSNDDAFLLRSAEVSGSLEYDDKLRDVHVALPSWTAAARNISPVTAHEITLRNTAPGTARYQIHSLPLDDLELAASRDRDDLRIQTARIVSGETNASLNGKLTQLTKEPNADVELKALLQLALLPPAQRPLDGAVEAALRITGPIAKPMITGRVEGVNLRAKDFGPFQAMIRPRVQLGAPVAGIEEVDIRYAGGSLQAKGEVALEENATTKVEGQLRGIDLLPLSRAAKSPVAIASLASGSLSVSFPGMNFQAASGTVNLTLSPKGTPSKERAPLAGSLRVSAKQGDVQLSLASLEGLGIQVNAEAGRARNGALSGHASIEAPSLAAALAALTQVTGTKTGDVQGRAKFDLALSGTLEAPAVSAEGSVLELRTAGLQPMQLDAKLDATAKQVQLHRAVLSYQSRALLEASGQFEVNGPIQGQLKADALPIAVIREIAGLAAPVDGAINGSFLASGTAQQPQVEGTFAVRELRAYEEDFGQLEANLSFRNGVAQLDQLFLRKPAGGELKAAASYELETERYQISAEGQGIRIEHLTLPSKDTLQTVVALKANGEGTLAQKQLEASVTATDLVYAGKRIGGVEATAQVLGDGAALKTRLLDFGASAAANVGMAAPYPATVEVRLDKTDLSKLPLEPALQGSFTAQVNGSGELDHWQDGEAKGLLEAFTVEQKGVPIQLAAPAAFSLRNRTLQLEPLRIATGASTATLEGSIPVEVTAAPADVRLQGELTAEDALKLAAAFDSPVNLEAKGKANWDLALKGPWKQFTPSGAVTVQMESVHVPGAAPITNVDGHLEIRNGQVEIDRLSARLGEGSLTGSGAVPLSLAAPEGWLATPASKEPGKVRLAWDKLEWAAITQRTDDKLAGSSSGELNLDIAGLKLTDLSGALSITPLDVRFGAFTAQLQQPARISLAKGVARVDHFELQGSVGRLALSGEASLLDPQPLNLRVEGAVDPALIGAFSDEVTAAGEAKLELSAAGTLRKPELNGFLDIAKLDVAVPSVDLQLDGASARVNFDKDRIALRLRGALNGGTMTGRGSLRIANGQAEDVRMNLTAASVYLQYPRDLKTLFNAAIGVRSVDGRYQVTGDVQVLEGSYDEDINIDELVLKRVNEVSSGEEKDNAMLKLVDLNVSLRTASPVLIKNNLAETAISTDLRVVGTAERPGVLGRVVLEEGGEIRLNEREYVVERGVVTFIDEKKIRPTLDLLARTQVASHDISLQVQGEQGDLKSTLTSEPPLPEADIISLLVTGRTLDTLAGAETEATKEQVLSYLATRVGGQLTRSVERAFGISQVRIQPNLIAPETNPGARLTVGQDITPSLRLTYSMDLARSSDQFWLGEWNLSKRFLVRGLKDFDNVYRAEFRHELQFGSIGPVPTVQPRGPVKRIGSIQFQGNFYLTDKELASRLKLKSGKKHDFFAVRKAVTRLQEAYWSRDFHEARVRTERDVQETLVNLKFDINEGVRVDIAYEGWNPPNAVRKEVRRIWETGGFDMGRVLKATAELRTALLADGHFEPLITHQIRQPDAEHKQVLFEIHPNARYSDPEIVIEGAAKIPEKRLRRVVHSHRPKTDLYLHPQRVAESLRRLYREEGYLEASVAPPKLETDKQNLTARFVVKVDEGQQFKISGVSFSGNVILSDQELGKDFRLEPGMVYLDDRIELAQQELAERYQQLGFNDVEIETTARRNSQEGTVQVDFAITENLQSVLEEVTIAGTVRTSRRLVLSQSGLAVGEIVNSRKFTDARRNLYQTGAYSLVDVETDEISADDQTKRLRAKITVRELTPFAIKYGGYYDTDRGPGVIADFVTRNYLHSARVAGVRTRYDSRFQEVRGYFSQPLLRRFPVGTTATIYANREVRDAFIAARLGVSVMQQSRIRERWILNYGYRMERTHTYEKEPDPLFPFDVTLRVAPLQTSLTRDTRDDILDATRGSFISQSLEYAPESLGSQLKFVRYFGQYFHYAPLSKPAEIPWSNGARRPRFIYAGAVRVGAASGLGGQELVASERFFAGGGNSIRGFRQDHVGPLDFFGDPTGGDAMFVTNHELRFPGISIVEGVAFVDAGNVYDRARNLKPWDVRTAAGMGVRIRTPYFLFRLDYGFNLNPKPGEDRGRFFFSIGQAF